MPVFPSTERGGRHPILLTISRISHLACIMLYGKDGNDDPGKGVSFLINDKIFNHLKKRRLRGRSPHLTMSHEEKNLTQVLALRECYQLNLKSRRHWSVFVFRRLMVISNLCWLALVLGIGYLVYEAANAVRRNEERYHSIVLAQQQKYRTAEEHTVALMTEILRLRDLNQYTQGHLIDLAANLQSIIQTAHGAQVDFLEWVVPEALRIQVSHNIPPSATVAMAIYESNYGRSVLASQYHNYFGIKAQQDSWSGPKTLQTTRDRGQSTQAWFRCYRDRRNAVAGYADFLKASRLYRSAFTHRDGERFVQAILAGGYCPDKDYLANIRLIIQRHQLHKLDPTSDKVTQTPPASAPPPKALASRR